MDKMRIETAQPLALPSFAFARLYTMLKYCVHRCFKFVSFVKFCFEYETNERGSHGSFDRYNHYNLQQNEHYSGTGLSLAHILLYIEVQRIGRSISDGEV